MTRCWCVTGPALGPAICIVTGEGEVRVTPCMMMAQLRTPGYGTSGRPGGPGAQSLPRHPGVTFGGHWTWTQQSRGRLQTAPADDRQVATGRNYNYTQKKLQIMGKSNLWQARPNPAASAELVVPLRKANGPIFQDFCQGAEQRLFLMLMLKLNFFSIKTFLCELELCNLLSCF